MAGENISDSVSNVRMKKSQVTNFKFQNPRKFPWKLMLGTWDLVLEWKLVGFQSNNNFGKFS